MIYSGRFKVTSPYGLRTLNGEQEYHRGIDVVGIGNKYVCAVAAGVVGASTIIFDKSNRTWEWGNYIRVDGFDGRKYYYCHLSKRLANVGQTVKAGDHLGVEGNTGKSFGSHCHFEVRTMGGESINPASFIGAKNAIGTYGIDYRAEAQQRFGLSAGTMKYLDRYTYSADLYRKLVDAE